MTCNNPFIRILLLLLATVGCFGQISKINYHFNGNISEEVIRNYLSRSITMAEICTSPIFKVDGEDHTLADDIRLIRMSFDNNGYLQMPVCRMIADGKNPVHKYKANIKSEACPNRTGLETKIKEIWSNNDKLVKRSK